MSTPLGSLVTAGTRSQEAATAAMRSWTEGAQALAGAQNAMADVPDLYASYLDAVRKVLAGQRQLADALVSAAQTAQSVTNQFTRATETALDALQAATTSVASVAKTASEQSSAFTRAATSATN
jgi:hypothetical protein